MHASTYKPLNKFVKKSLPYFFFSIVAFYISISGIISLPGRRYNRLNPNKVIDLSYHI